MPKLVIYTPDPEEFERHIAPGAPDLEIAIAPSDDLDAAVEIVREADFMLAWRTPPELLAAATRLRWIMSYGAGVDHLVGAPIPAEVAITRVVDVFGPAMAEFVVGYCYAAMLDVRRILEQQRRAEWSLFWAKPLRDKTAVVVGLGSIGREVCRLLAANGVRVLGVSRSGRPDSAATQTFAVAELERALPEADFLVLVAPLTPETRGLIGARQLGLLPVGAWLINVARGPLVVEAELLAALREGELGGAVLDVFDREPLPTDHPFWRMDNVIVTPHMSGPDDFALISSQFVENYQRLKQGQPLLRTVDRERGY
jgi:glyoxylate/hydroxypyruvate reductase A